MFSDFGYVFVWWLCFFVIGLIFLPLTKKLFANFFDQGYLFSKVLGILFSSYFVWLLASLKIMPFNKETIWLVLIIGLLVNLFIYSRKSPRLASTEVSAKSRRAQSPTRPLIVPPVGGTPSTAVANYQLLITVILEELMFFVTLAFWSYIRGFQPDIQGLEKFMDFGFVNSILRSKYFPPADMWFAGKFINYYYYGHYITAFFTKLSGIDSAITYNLMIGTLFAFCFSLTFSLTGNLVYLWKKLSLKVLVPNYKLLITNYSSIITAGLISALLISLSANLHPAFYNFKMKILKKPYCDGSFNYWYPNATRYIGVCPDVEDKTIHEFPSYSFIVSDLHGHVSDIPFVFLFLALALNLFIHLKEKGGKILHFTFYILHSPISLILAVMFMTNQWDFPIYIIVLGLILLFSFYKRGEKISKILISCFITGCILTLPAIVLILPFQRNFEPFFKGIAFVNAHSKFYQLLVLWGAPWFFGVSFLAFLFRHKLRQKNHRFGGFKKENLVKWFSKILGVEIQLKKTPDNSQLDNLKISNLFLPDLFIIILLIVSLFLIIFPEIFYIKDIYIPSHHRANTMFKLTYQAFMMYSICIGYIYTRIFNSKRKNFTCLAGRQAFYILHFTFVILLIALLVYPWYSIPGYYGKLERKNYKGLYGLSFLKRLYPEDYETILWLNTNIKDQPVVLEAVGDSYTDYERVSMATGLPTIQGWLVHEWLWRGSFDEPGKRSSEVQTIYESKDLNQTKDLLKKYNVKYVVVGGMERTKYPNLNEEKFKSLGKKVFESGKTAIYEII